MESKTQVWGILTNCFLLVALAMSWYDLPNQILFILAGICILSLVGLPLFLVQSNNHCPGRRIHNWGFFACSVLIIPVLILFLQDARHLTSSSAIMLLTPIAGYLLWFVIEALLHKKVIWNRPSFLHQWLMFLVLLILCFPIEFQLSDKNYSSSIQYPTYSKGEGPLVYFDGGHNNFHTLDSRLFATGKLLEKDGYRVQSLNGKVSLEELKKCKIFLISNALNAINEENWNDSVYPAFNNNEVNDIKEWVYKGGALFLIADHAPFPTAIDNLASQFGFQYQKGSLHNTTGNNDFFFRSSNTLINGIITNGRNPNERVDSILTFSGSAIKIPPDATSILELDSNWILDNNFGTFSPSLNDRYTQGAYKEYGKGRVIVYGEAMMFTAQLGFGLGWFKMGMNSGDCPDNHQLFLNSIHWLDGLIKNKLTPTKPKAN